MTDMAQGVSRRLENECPLCAKSGRSVNSLDDGKRPAYWRTRNASTNAENAGEKWRRLG